MAAFNNIIIQDTCPFCKSKTTIICQTHIASSFDGIGNERFCNNAYELNQKMHWWEENSKKYDSWKENSEVESANDIAEEECFSECQKCNKEFLVSILFKKLVPTLVKNIIMEKES